MEPRYLRNVPALSEGECALLKTKRVCVVGCGGLGGYLIELLCRVGVGHIRVLDGDVFDETNLNRQLLSEEALIGQSKAEAAAQRVARITSETELEAISSFLTEKNATEIIAGCDAVLDALDNAESRRILSRACGNAGIPYIYGAISGWVAQAGISMPGDGLIDALYPDGVEIRDKSVLSFTPALCASMQAALCVRLLCGRDVDTGKLYYSDLLNMEFETIEFK